MSDAEKPTISEFLTQLGQAAKKAFWVVIVIVLVAVIGGAVQENWGCIVCWVNDEIGSIGRTCALHKIAESRDHKGGEIIEVTGIAEITENVKRVEFTWRAKPDAQNPNPQAINGAMTFRKYDDGWRPSE